MLTVVCVYWQGRFRGREHVYTPEWVEKMKSMVERNLTIPHRFVCLSNVDVPAEKIPLKHNWPGWWSKIEIFRPDLFEGRVMYLDLDTLIIQNLDDLIQWPEKFAIIQTAPTPGKSRTGLGKIIIRRYNSSLMVWDAEFGYPLYETFMERRGRWMAEYRGDQDFIAHIMPELETWPSSWTAKFRFLKDKRVPPDGDIRILLCQSGGEGKTNNLVKKYKWMKNYWK